MARKHLPVLDLERYYLGMVQEPELATVEEHILSCPMCARRAEKAQEFVDMMRAAIVRGDFDLDWLETNSGKTPGKASTQI
jgi:hypothetical protein